MLLYSTTLDVSGQSWQLCMCHNCKSVLYAKRLTAGAGAGVSMTIYYLNSKLLCSNEELSRRRNHKSYSETFGVIIMDRIDSNPGASAIIPPKTGVVNSVSSLSIGSLSAHAPLDGKQQRIRQLQAHQQQRVQAEIAETNQAIERYTEQKFELLKIFREKSNQEAAYLMDLIQQIPEAANELLDDAMPVTLEVTGGAINYAGAGPTARRRNTISSRRELSIPTTPTTPLAQPPSFLSSVQQAAQQPPQFSSLLSMMQQPQHELPNATILTARKMSNFDTPPATPESTPMSVGSSPTFRQQQQHQQAVTAGRVGVSNTSPTAASAGTEDADDCLFALDDMDGPGSQSIETMQNVRIYQQQQHQHYQRQLQQQPQELLPQQQQQDNMSDADEAEGKALVFYYSRKTHINIFVPFTDALNSSFSIPMRMPAEKPYSNFARSMPVEIANSPLAERINHNKMNSNNNNVVDDVEVGVDCDWINKNAE